jgi:hypothetical protein
MWGAEYVLGDKEQDEKKRDIYANRSAVKLDSITRSRSGDSRSSGNTYNYIYSKPFTSPGGNTGSQGIYGLTIAQHGALQGLGSAVSSRSFDVQAFVGALQAVISAFGGSK